MMAARSTEDTARKIALNTLDVNLKSAGNSIEALLASTYTLDSKCAQTDYSYTPAKFGDAVGVATVEQVISGIDERIRDMEELEERLQAGRIALKALRNRSHILSPINRLPDECLSIVFLEGCESTQDIFAFNFTSCDDDMEEPQSFALAVSQVCRRWRSVALGTRELWAQVPNVNSYESTADRVEISLERAGNCPLSLIFDLREQHEELYIWLEHYLWSSEQVLELLEPKISQCADLTAYLSRADIGEHLLHAFAHATNPARLKTLKLVGKYPDRRLDGKNWEKKRMVELMSGIRILHLHGHTIPWQYPTFMTRLTELQLSEIWEENWPSSTEMMEILRACPSLECLGFYWVGLSGAVDSTSSPITMPCLQTINLTWSKRGIFTCLLPSIRVPALANLRTQGDCAEAAHSLTEFISSLSQAPVRRLRLSYTEHSIPPQKIESLIRLLPNLTTLEFATIPDLEPVLTALSADDNLCPNLEKLTLDDRFAPRTEIICLLKRLVQRRFTGEHLRPLNWVKFHHSVRIDPAVDADFSWSRWDEGVEENSAGERGGRDRYGLEDAGEIKGDAVGNSSGD